MTREIGHAQGRKIKRGLLGIGSDISRHVLVPFAATLVVMSVGSSVTEASAETSASTPGAAPDYSRAALVYEPNLAGLIFNDRVAYHWVEGGKALWYATNAPSGPQYVRVDAITGEKSVLSAPPPEPPTSAKSFEVLSPDLVQALFCRDDNLWVRNVGTGVERRLTNDGEPYFSYGKLFDDNTKAIERRRAGGLFPPANTFWSPDGRLIFGHRNDERQILPYPYVESVPLDGSFRPILHNVRMTLLGEPGRIHQDVFVLDLASGRQTKVETPKGWFIDSTPLSWSPRSDKVFVLATADDKRSSALMEIDTRTGGVRQVIVEKSDDSSAYFFNVFEYSYPNVRILDGGREAVWFSQRDGLAHLYLYDIASGQLKRALTPGAGVVLDIISVDENARTVFATMAGRDVGRDPYQRDLYSIPLDAGAPRRMTDGVLDHAIEAPTAPFWAGVLTARGDLGAVSPDHHAFVDVASTVDSPAVTSLRAVADGRLITVLERADPSKALTLGWRPPVRVKVKAADGKTDIWGAIYLPPDFDPAQRYPVIDALYGGPQLIVAPRNFAEASTRAGLVGRASLAALGFIVVTLDGRGTPGRSLEFWRAGYGDFADVAIDDHVAGLKALHGLYPSMDLDRVGVYGHSFGGYVAARAMLRYPDFFKVGVSSAAVQNWQGFRDAYEQYQGVVDYGGGARLKPTPNAVPEHYQTLDNGALAGRLSGDLLIAYADLDENALPSSTLQFIAALTRANKPYDLIYMASGDHGFARNPYFVKRQWDYFVERLKGQTPPRDFVLTNAPGR